MFTRERSTSNYLNTKNCYEVLDNSIIEKSKLVAKTSKKKLNKQLLMSIYLNKLKCNKVHKDKALLKLQTLHKLRKEVYLFA